MTPPEALQAQQAVEEKAQRLRDLRAEAQSIFQEILQLTAVAGPGGDKPRITRLRQTSVAGWAYRVLASQDRPMHVRDLQRAIERERGPIQRTTLVSSLARYSKRSNTFARMEENVYGLLEWLDDQEDVQVGLR